MKLRIVSRHSPRPEGTPTGRVFHALGEGLLAEGHDVEAVTWAADQPHHDLPPWCTWRALPAEPRWRTRARALARPRHDVARIGWPIDDDAVALAEDPLSFAAVAGSARAAVTFHYLTRVDATVLGRTSARDVQDRRHERATARVAPGLFAFSDRVAGLLGDRARVVPIAYPVPAEALPFVEEPVALLLANWTWPPNIAALATLLAEWPHVRALVPDARLLLAGWGSDGLPVHDVAGVDLAGPVERAADALARAAVLAFPCPPTSGPKVKVMEALSHGVPVVTTAAGAEGLVLGGGEGAVVADGDFAESLAKTLADPDQRRRLSATGRAAMLAHHAPRPAARARVAAFEAAFA